MADDAPPPPDGGHPIGPQRRRPAPTIDLKATEVASEPPRGSEAPAAAGLPPTDTPARPATDPAAPHDPLSPDAGEAVPPNAAATDKPDPAEPVTRRRSWLPLPPELPWAALGAGAAGGAGAALALVLLWLALPSRDPSAPRLASIETQLRELAARPAPQAPDLRPHQQALEALTARLSKLETALGSARPGVDPAWANRVGTLEERAKTLSDNLAALGRRADTSAAALAQLQKDPRPDPAEAKQIEALTGRISALETTDRAVADALAKREAAAEDRAVRFALAAALLRAAVERNEPFAAELAAVRALDGPAEVLAPLAAFAASGVPSASALGRELAVLIPPMSKLSGSPNRDAGLIDRLQANAEKLVRIRPADETPGDAPGAILSRVEIRAAHGDIAAALAELNRLPERVRGPAKAWMAKAEGRSRALDASRRISVDAVANLQPAR